MVLVIIAWVVCKYAINCYYVPIIVRNGKLI